MKNFTFFAGLALTLCYTSSFADEYTINNYAYEGTLGKKTKVRVLLEKRSDGLISGTITYLKFNKTFRLIGNTEFGLSEFQANGESSGDITLDPESTLPTEWSSMEEQDKNYTFNLKSIDFPKNYESTFQYGDMAGNFAFTYTNPYRGNSGGSTLKVSANHEFEFSDLSTSPFSNFIAKDKLTGNKTNFSIKSCSKNADPDLEQYTYQLSNDNNSPKFTVEIFKDFAVVKDYSDDSLCEGFGNYGFNAMMLRVKNID